MALPMAGRYKHGGANGGFDCFAILMLVEGRFMGRPLDISAARS